MYEFGLIAPENYQAFKTDYVYMGGYIRGWYDKKLNELANNNFALTGETVEFSGLAVLEATPLPKTLGAEWEFNSVTKTFGVSNPDLFLANSNNAEIKPALSSKELILSKGS